MTDIDAIRFFSIKTLSYKYKPTLNNMWLKKNKETNRF